MAGPMASFASGKTWRTASAITWDREWRTLSSLSCRSSCIFILQKEAPLGSLVRAPGADCIRIPSIKDEKPIGALRGSTLIRGPSHGGRALIRDPFTGVTRQILNRPGPAGPDLSEGSSGAVFSGRRPGASQPLGTLSRDRSVRLLVSVKALQTLSEKSPLSSRPASGSEACRVTLTSFLDGVYTFRRMKKHIDFYTIDIGGGHIAPAVAIKEQFDLLGYKDVEVHVVNLGLVLGANFLRYIYRFYWNSALRYPPLINAFYRGADNPFMIKIIDRILGITILPRFVQYLEREKPDLVVSTYFTFTHYLELLKRVGQLDATTVVLNPEPFDSHYIWFSPAFDWSLVFSRKSAIEIAKKGIPAGRLKVFQFPVKPSFARRRETRETLRRRLQLERKPFTALFFFGAEGVGPVKKYIAALIERKLDIQAVVVCGRNERLRRDLETLAAGPMGSVRMAVRGYVNNLADYIAAADVVVGKSGPNQVFETLVQGRPLHHLQLPCQRKGNDQLGHRQPRWLAYPDSGPACHTAFEPRRPAGHHCRVPAEHRPPEAPCGGPGDLRVPLWPCKGQEAQEEDGRPRSHPQDQGRCGGRGRSDNPAH